MYRTIMVLLDGSSFSAHALRAARLSDAALHLMCVPDNAQHSTDTTTRRPDRASPRASEE